MKSLLILFVAVALVGQTWAKPTLAEDEDWFASAMVDGQVVSLEAIDDGVLEKAVEPVRKAPAKKTSGKASKAEKAMIVLAEEEPVTERKARRPAIKSRTKPEVVVEAVPEEVIPPQRIQKIAPIRQSLVRVQKPVKAVEEPVEPVKMPEEPKVEEPKAEEMVEEVIPMDEEVPQQPMEVEEVALLDGNDETPMIEGEEELEMIEETTTTTTTTTTTEATTTTTEEPSTTRRSRPNPRKPAAKSTVTSTASPAAESSTSGRIKSPSSGKRGQQAKTIEDLPIEPAMTKDSTSPASIDTASVSVKAPNRKMKPTGKPAADDEPKDLSEFLRRRKIQRIEATTTVDPFIAILATATPPSTDEPVTFAVDRAASSSSGRFSSSNKRPAPTSRARTGSIRTTTEAPTTTEAAVEVTTASRNRFTLRRSSTTTAQPIIDEPTVETTSAKSKPVPKRPVAFRPVANSILRRRDQTPAPVPVAPEEVEDEMEPTTRRTLRRASGRLIIIRPVTV